MSDIHVVVLAAGKGTRMKSAVPKVLHPIAGRALIEHVLVAARAMKPRTLTVVVGHQADEVRAALTSQPDVTFVVQEPQLGTAHALLMAEPALAGARGNLILLSGDVPLLRAQTLQALLNAHQAGEAAATVATAVVDTPRGYGRIVRHGGRIARIVEEKDATPVERAIHEINAGIYAFALDGLFDAVRRIAAENAQREYYLPDLVGIYRRAGQLVEAFAVDDAREILGINTRAELASLGRLFRMSINEQLMADGVTFVDPSTTYVDADVEIGVDTTLHPGVILGRGTTIGTGCIVHSGARIVASTIGDGVTVFDHSLIIGSTIRQGASVGPFAHLRGQVDVGVNARVGNFVELKKTVLGTGTKAGHLAYLGDAKIGDYVNIGAGAITCNYDGRDKHVTTIGDGAFIGSDTQLIAPVTIGANAYVGTGTTIREDVPAGALAVSAGKQRNIEGWVRDKALKKAGA